MFAANIGWGPAAGLGFALGTDRRLLVIGGDGGLQMTSGAIGDYVKCGTNAIFVCINNDG
jgi:TPP-dependent 2-oxoacid decarboxylase